MPTVIAAAERNDVSSSDFTGSVSSGSPIVVSGLARAGLSDTGVGTWYQGTYGALLINPNGTFTYRLDQADPDTDVLGAGQAAEERFTYTFLQNGVERTDTIVVRISGIDEPGQQVTAGSDPIAFAADATIALLQRLEMGPRAVTFRAGEDDHFTLTNEGSIHAEATYSEAIGVEAVADFPWNGSATLVNRGLIEAHVGPSAHQAIGVGAASGPGMDNSVIVNHGVIRAISDATGTTYSQATGAGGARIVNTGTIEALSTIEAWAVEIAMYGSLENSGYIYAESSNPIYGRGIVGVRVHQASRVTIDNSGTIHAVSPTALESVGITMFRDSTNHYAFGRVNNSGTIVADIAVQAYATSAGGITGLHAYNSGHVEGAFDMDLGLNILFNQAGGEWIGAVRGGIDEDAVRNRGRIDGTIALGDGRDLFDGRGGIQTGAVSGDAGDDTLLGGNGVDNLAGGDGGDYIAGGGGADSIAGGAGVDVFAYHSANDSTSAAVDTIADFQSGIDRLDLGALAPSSVSLAASGGMTTVTANTAGGLVTIRVGGTIAMSDIVTAPKGAVATGTGAHETLYAHVVGSQLDGLGGDDVLEGSAGADRLDGGTGQDLMRGGDGNDVYYADDFGDLIVEFDGEGIDELRTSASQRLQGYVENLTMLGNGHIFASGNDLGNIIIGNSGSNEIFADRGDDVVTGGGGGDWLNGGEGKDLFVYLSLSDSTKVAVDNLVQFDTGDDRIDVRAVTPVAIHIQETMLGYWGNFAISNVVVVETSAGPMQMKVEGKLFRSDFIVGNEIVGTAAAESLTGTASDDVIIGGAADDILVGLDGADTLSGQEDDDRLDGGAGADTMTGGVGDDVYLVDSAADYLWEKYAEGYDVVVTSVSYTLAPQVFVERLETSDQAGTAAIDLTGNTQDNLILGNAGNNRLDGGINTDATAFSYGGIDTLIGYGGDDVLVVDGSEDIVVEALGGGHDLVIARYTYVLTAGAEIESLMADQAGIDPLDLTGNEFGQILRGNSAVNSLDGGGGADTFLFAAVADSTSENTDRIRNFESGIDKIDLSAVSPTSVSWTQQTDQSDNQAYNLVSVQSAAGAMAIRVDGTLAMSDFILTPAGQYGTAGDDNLQGGDGDDLLVGLDGNDTLDGGFGADRMEGGNGDDSYHVDHAGDVLVETPGAGTDTVFSSIGYTLASDVENLTLTGSLSTWGVGNALGNVMVGNAASNALEGGGGNDSLFGGGANGDGLDGEEGNDFLDGGAGSDVMRGGIGDDMYVVDHISDMVVEQASAGIDTVQVGFAYTLGANVENLTLVGTAIAGNGNDLANRLVGHGGGNHLDGRAGNDVLEGGGGNDWLAGGAGSDRMFGGAGNDIYQVDSTTDLVVELAGEGTDRVDSSITYTLGADVENLTLIGSAAINGTGNALVNELAGNAAANRLDGGTGADIMKGFAGDDIYIVDVAGDQVVEGSASDGKDLVRSSVSFTLGFAVEKLALTGTAAINGTGNELNNSLTGNSAANTLDGGAGADAMAGGAGNDTYLVDNLGDRVAENANEGSDTVRSSVSFSLTANIESLVLTGTAAVNATGNSAANTITGNAAANLINGGGGADAMAGGNGNDIYIVETVGDVVTEAANEGTDLVKSSISFTLGANVEKLTLRGAGAIDGTGNALANTIAGNEAANRLDGGAGADKLMGAGGNDTYVVDHIADQVIEASSGGGSDTVLSSVTFTLGDHVERLTLTGASAIDGNGNDLANTLAGNAAANRLDGGRGNDALSGGGGDDILLGGLGLDRLEGGAGADKFVFDKPLGAGNVDTILDFSRGSDDIVLENAVFKGLAAGALSASALRIGSAAGDADDRIVYDPATGNLYYDADGNGAAAQILFATLDNLPATLSASDFAVI